MWDLAVFLLKNEIVEYKLDMTILEDVGIFPNIAIDASESIKDEHDIVLEKAIEIM